MFYSASTNSFYTPEVHETMPSDVVEITNEAWQQLLAAQSTGAREIRADEQGFPIARDRDAPDPALARARMVLTFPQLLIGLVAEGWLGEAEGEAWLAGTPPAAALALVERLPEEQRFAAKVRLTKPTAFARLDPLVVGLAALAGKTDGDLDVFFKTYARD